MTREETLKEIREAKDAGNRALMSLRNAQNMLNSAGNWGLLDMFGGDFLTFADFFFDGFIADWMVQSKIGDAKCQVSAAIGKIEKVLHDLNTWERQIGSDRVC